MRLQRTVVADTGQGGTEVRYTAEFSFKGAARLFAPFLRPAFARLGTAAQTGMYEALARR